MKAILEFDLPDENGTHQAAVHAMDWALSAWDMDQQLRRWQKYGHEFQSADEAIDAARDRLREILAEHGVSTDQIA